MTQISYKLDFDTSYHQFYLIDPEATADTGSDKFWTNEAYEDRLAIEDGVLGIGIQSYGHVRAELLLLSNAPEENNFHDYDHVVEGGIRLASGILEVIDCPQSEVELKIIIEPGNYRARVYSINLDANLAEDNGDDQYKIEIWPCENLERKVLKRFSNR